MYEQVEEYQRNHNATQLINHEVNKTKLINYISINQSSNWSKKNHPPSINQSSTQIIIEPSSSPSQWIQIKLTIIKMQTPLLN